MYVILYDVLCYFSIRAAYIALINLKYDASRMHKYYAGFMSIAVATSLCVIVWSNFYFIRFLACRKPKTKVMYVLMTQLFYYLAIAVSVVAIISFLIAIGMAGYTKKTNVDYKTVAAIIATSVCVVGALILRFLQVVFGYYYRAQDKDAPPIPDTGIEKRLTTQISGTNSSGSFLTASIIYQILFIDPTGSLLENTIFVIFVCLSFSFGALSVVASNTILFLMGQLPSTQKNRFCFYLKEKYAVETRLFVLVVLSLLFWLMSCTLIGFATYKRHRNRWVGAVFCSLAILFLLYSLRNGYLVSFSKDDKNKSSGVSSDLKERLLSEESF